MTQETVFCQGCSQEALMRPATYAAELLHETADEAPNGSTAKTLVSAGIRFVCNDCRDALELVAGLYGWHVDAAQL